MSSPLHRAVRQKNINAVSNLIPRGANDDATDSAFYETSEKMRLLLDAGTDANLKDHDNKTPLHEAVFCGTSEMVKLLLDAGADASVKDDHGSTPLHEATWRKNPDSPGIIKLLLDAGADVNAKDCHEITPLHEAVSNRNLEIVKLLLDAGGDANVKDHWGETPLHRAAERRANSPEIVKLLLDSGADVNAKGFKNKTPLHEAVSENLDLLKLLFEVGAYASEKYRRAQRTPLHTAAQKGENSLEIVKLLLDAGADVNAKGFKNKTPLQEAVSDENSEMVKLLLDAGADANVKDHCGKTPLHRAAEKGENCLEIMKLLLDAGADVNAKDCHEITPFAISNGNLEIVKLLLDAGADANVKNQWGETPLHRAAQKGENCLEIVKLLLDAGADVNAKDRDGRSPLHEAVSDGNLEIVKLLLDAGAYANVIDRWTERTPLHTAAQKGENSLEIVKLLLDAGADVNAKDRDGRSPLHEAVSDGNLEIVKLLLDAGADANVKDRCEKTPLHTAAQKGENSLEIVKLLFDAGANVNDIYDNGDTVTTMYVKFLKSQLDHEAIKSTFRLLIEYSDINLKDKKGESFFCQILNFDGYYTKRNGTLMNKIILQYIAQLKTLNYYVDTTLVETISRKNDYNNYFKTCTEELKIAKSTKLKNCWVTFLNLLVDDECKFVKYAGNEDLVKDFEMKVKEFPIYGATMKNNVTTGIDSRKFYDRAANILSHNLPIFNPTHLIIRDSLDILTARDWKKLCE